ncbi:MAG: hypothetical protein KDI48_19430, partial [Xanthomonadales bacterium]|nr:hypothetical protein [Xanthomonadales bacterium]
DGNVSAAYDYLPFGQQIAQSGSSSQPYTFNGAFGVRRMDPSGRYYRMGLRVYDALTASFLSREPLWPLLREPALLNPYQFAYQRPLTFADPTGAYPSAYRNKLEFLVGGVNFSTRETSLEQQKFRDEVLARERAADDQARADGDARAGFALLALAFTGDVDLVTGRELSETVDSGELADRVISRYRPFRESGPKFSKACGGEFAELLRGRDLRTIAAQRKFLYELLNTSYAYGALETEVEGAHDYGFYSFTRRTAVRALGDPAVFNDYLGYGVRVEDRLLRQILREGFSEDLVNVSRPFEFSDDLEGEPTFEGGSECIQ